MLRERGVLMVRKATDPHGNAAETAVEGEDTSRPPSDRQHERSGRTDRRGCCERAEFKQPPGAMEVAGCRRVPAQTPVVPHQYHHYQREGGG